ncbi:MAG TPA: polymerase, partial [Albitalea sp.]|nr:polymerase [Albitalea sp.]
HYLLDTRLMMAWANALNESGQVDKARYIAQRLREFRNDDAAPFFAPCDEPAPQGRPQPFQCTPPSRTYDYRDFR